MDLGGYLFGQIAVEWGLLSREELGRAVDELAGRREAGTRTSIGEFLQGKGLLTAEQVDAIVTAQRYVEVRDQDRTFGQIAVNNGLATASQVAECYAAQQAEHKLGRTPARLGELLVQRGYMSATDVQAVLAAQERFLGAGGE